MARRGTVPRSTPQSHPSHRSRRLGSIHLDRVLGQLGPRGQLRMRLAFVGSRFVFGLGSHLLPRFDNTAGLRF